MFCSGWLLAAERRISDLSAPYYWYSISYRFDGAKRGFGLKEKLPSSRPGRLTDTHLGCLLGRIEEQLGTSIKVLVLQC